MRAVSLAGCSAVLHASRTNELSLSLAGIVHRDIKTKVVICSSLSACCCLQLSSQRTIWVVGVVLQNLLLNKRGRLCLIDFGMAKRLPKATDRSVCALSFGVSLKLKP